MYNTVKAYMSYADKEAQKWPTYWHSLIRAIIAPLTAMIAVEYIDWQGRPWSEYEDGQIDLGPYYFTCCIMALFLQIIYCIL